MTDNIHKLSIVSAANPEPDPELIATIERILDEARRGEILSLAYAVAKPGGGVATAWEGSGSTRIQLAAAVSLLAARYPRALIEEDED